MAASFRGDQGLYAVFEQKLHRVGTDDDRGIGVFGRGSYSPPDRNLIDIYADGGFEFVGLSDTRGRMTSSAIVAAYAQLAATQALDRDFQFIYGAGWPIRSSEALLTAVYQYEVRAGLTLQPNVQFIRHPGGCSTRSARTLTWQTPEGRGGPRPANGCEILTDGGAVCGCRAAVAIAPEAADGEDRPLATPAFRLVSSDSGPRLLPWSPAPLAQRLAAPASASR